MDIGVFIPINNNGWIISATSPQYMPSFELNKAVVQKAEGYGLDFALSMIKLHGFGGKTEFWDHGLESFTLMAALASVTKRIRLFASTAVLTLPPAMVARMAATIDDVSGGRFGVNIVSGWHKIEYTQMGLWPGDEHFAKRYDYSTEYVRILRELWEDGVSDHKGDYFQMDKCVLSPRPPGRIPVVSAGQSDRGMEFAAEWCEYNFCLGEGLNEPTKAAGVPARVLKAAEKTGRDVGAYMLYMVIADETDEAAFAKWDSYVAGADQEALAHLFGKAAEDKTASADSTAAAMTRAANPVNFNMGTLVGSYAKVAAMLDEVAAMPGVKGIMLTFDDFLKGMDDFGTRIQPLMACRKDRLAIAAE
ncbi:pyrimidine utilization protein A [Roseomonas sp. PWR1]|uniref:Pyrimidine monooxygenase RutA n=1 Tax=Roseomonas nitratireducens TaxID=2820810 RepID=A0ABS4AUA7_9PROT|nr:pyrimidine utilization protein A [Neoroseomonas nitratireducens]MBP0464948.1 pyrimidine utilization protein A [Neoroseomonas nitratireducens]